MGAMQRCKGALGDGAGERRWLGTGRGEQIVAKGSTGWVETRRDWKIDGVDKWRRRLWVFRWCGMRAWARRLVRSRSARAEELADWAVTKLGAAGHRMFRE